MFSVLVFDPPKFSTSENNNTLLKASNLKYALVVLILVKCWVVFFYLDVYFFAATFLLDKTTSRGAQEGNISYLQDDESFSVVRKWNSFEKDHLSSFLFQAQSQTENQSP